MKLLNQKDKTVLIIAFCYSASFVSVACALCCIRINILVIVLFPASSGLASDVNVYLCIFGITIQPNIA